MSVCYRNPDIRYVEAAGEALPSAGEVWRRLSDQNVPLQIDHDNRGPARYRLPGPGR